MPASSTWLSLLIGGFLCSSPSPALKHHGGLNDPACKKYCEEEEMERRSKTMTNAWHFGKKTSKNLTGARGVDLATYSQNHIDVAVRNGPGSLRLAPDSTQWQNPKPTCWHNSIMTCWASSALSHFLLSNKQNKINIIKQTIVWRQRETTVDLTLNFQLTTRFLFFSCFVFLWLIALWGPKGETKSAQFLCLDWNNPSVECLNYKSSIISCFTCESLSSVGSNQS